MDFIIFAMINPWAGGAITFFAALSIFYIAYNMKRPKHWSEGYMVLGDRHMPKPKPKEPENNSMFPPGW